MSVAEKLDEFIAKFDEAAWPASARMGRTQREMFRSRSDEIRLERSKAPRRELVTANEE